MTVKELKEMPKEEFLSLKGATEELYNALQNSKEGWISISRVGDREGREGRTNAFGEGLSCRIDGVNGWYTTSIIQSIDWENHTFETLNSVYNFEFKNLDQLDKERKESFERINKMLAEHGSEN